MFRIEGSENFIIPQILSLIKDLQRCLMQNASVYGRMINVLYDSLIFMCWFEHFWEARKVSRAF